MGGVPQFLDLVAGEGSLALLRLLLVAVYHFLSAAESLRVTSYRGSRNSDSVRMQCRSRCDTWGTCIGAPSEELSGIAGVRKLATGLYLAAARGRPAECTLGRNRYAH